jgi:hypothetical protein
VHATSRVANFGAALAGKTGGLIVNDKLKLESGARGALVFKARRTYCTFCREVMVPVGVATLSGRGSAHA